MNYSQKMNLNFHENKIRHLSYKNPNAKRETIKPSRKRRKQKTEQVQGTNLG